MILFNVNGKATVWHTPLFWLHWFFEELLGGLLIENCHKDFGWSKLLQVISCNNNLPTWGGVAGSSCNSENSIMSWPKSSNYYRWPCLPLKLLPTFKCSHFHIHNQILPTRWTTPFGWMVTGCSVFIIDS